MENLQIPYFYLIEQLANKIFVGPQRGQLSFLIWSSLKFSVAGLKFGNCCQLADFSVTIIQLILVQVIQVIQAALKSEMLEL